MRRTGESRGFAFVRYKYADEAQKAVERLDGKFLAFYYRCVNDYCSFLVLLPSISLNTVDLYLHGFFREERGWTKYYGSVCKIWTKC